MVAMRRFFVFFLLLVFMLSVTSISLAKTDITVGNKAKTIVDSYELFWPIVPGRVMGDKLYSLKLFKEKIRESIILSSFKKADYLITISEKRLVEAEYLYKKSDFVSGQKTLTRLQGVWKKVDDLISQSKASGQTTVNLESRFVDSLGKQKMVLESLPAALSDSEKLFVDDSISLLDSISSKFSL